MAFEPTSVLLPPLHKLCYRSSTSGICSQEGRDSISSMSISQWGRGCWCFSSASARRCRGLFWTGTQSLGFHSFIHSPLIWWKLYSRPSRQRILDLDCYHPNLLIMPGGVGQEDQGLPPPLPPSARGVTLGKVGP